MECARAQLSVKPAMLIPCAVRTRTCVFVFMVTVVAMGLHVRTLMNVQPVKAFIILNVVFFSITRLSFDPLVIFYSFVRSIFTEY